MPRLAGLALRRASSAPGRKPSGAINRPIQGNVSSRDHRFDELFATFAAFSASARSALRSTRASQFRWPFREPPASHDELPELQFPIVAFRRVLAAGGSSVLKPAENSPATSLKALRISMALPALNHSAIAARFAASVPVAPRTRDAAP